MLYKNNFEAAKQRFTETWALENHDRPLLMLRAKKENPKPRSFTVPKLYYDRWTDVEYLIKANRHSLENTIFCAESFPIVNPNLGPDFFGATFGCELIYEERTSYACPIIKNWETDGDVKFDINNKYWQKMLEITNAFVEDSNGDYLVGITDIHAGVDNVVSLRGPQNVCTDMYDDPGYVCDLIERCRPVYKYQLEELGKITGRLGLGCSSWIRIWHPDLWYVTSADFICMISTEMFEKYILPGIIAEARMLGGKTIFHLDGPDALRHLDLLLEVPEIAGIQWVYGAGSDGARGWMDVMKKIQSKGKILQVSLKREDIKPVFENLRPEGAMYSFGFIPGLEEAEQIIKMAAV